MPKIMFSSRQKPMVVDSSLEDALSYIRKLIELCRDDKVQYKAISQSLEEKAKIIVCEHPLFIARHSGIDWAVLCNFNEVFINSSPRYVYRKSLVEYALKNGIKQEMDNLIEAIKSIRSDPFYVQVEDKENPPVLPQLSKLVGIIMDGRYFYSLKREIEQANINQLNYYFNPKILGEIPHLLPSEMPGFTENAKKMGRYHCLLSIAKLGEAIKNISDYWIKTYFPDELIEVMLKFRNIIFHPERKENFEKIKEFEGGKGELIEIIKYFIKNKDKFRESYKEARKSYNYCLGRSWEEKDYILHQDDPLIDLWQKDFITDAQIKAETKESKDLMQIAHDIKGYDCTFDFLQQLTIYANDQSDVECEEYKKLQKYIDKFDYHVWLKNSISLGDEIEELINSDKETISKHYTKNYSTAELNVSRNYCEELRENPNCNVENIKKWVYEKRLILLDKLMKCVVKVKSQKLALEKYNQKYREASKEDTIIRDYESLEQKYESSYKEQSDIKESINLIDIAARKAKANLCIKELKDPFSYLLHCLNQIKSEGPGIKNPDFINTSFGITYPTTTTIKFFVMVAGCLVRLIIPKIELEDNNGLITNFMSQEIGKEDPPITIEQVLKKFQVWRGGIAHNDKPQEGRDPIFEPFKPFKYIEYAKMLIPELESITNKIEYHEEIFPNFNNPEYMFELQKNGAGDFAFNAIGGSYDLADLCGVLGAEYAYNIDLYNVYF